jgi:hypothetical protein
LNLKFWIHSSLVLDEHRMDWVEYAILSEWWWWVVVEFTGGIGGPTPGGR